MIVWALGMRWTNTSVRKREWILINTIYLSSDGSMAYGGSKIEVRKFYFYITLIKLLNWIKVNWIKCIN